MYYYPFGLNMDGPWAAQYQLEETNQNGNGILDPILDDEGNPVVDQEKLNRYQYNGKELTEDLGLNWNDYGFRWYDPAIARWNAVDPLAGSTPNWTPYRYGYNNPIKFTDPFGLTENNEVDRQIQYDKDGNPIGVNLYYESEGNEPPINGLGYFYDDTGQYFWNIGKAQYEHFDPVSNSFVGYYSADEFRAPVGNYGFYFEAGGLPPSHSEFYTDMPSLAWSFFHRLYYLGGMKELTDVNKYPGVAIFESPWMQGGLTLGNMIFVQQNPTQNLLAHEYGHFLDFKYHFNFDFDRYISEIGLPSLRSAIKDMLSKSHSHNSSSPERRANILGKKFHNIQGNLFGEN